MSHYGTKRAVSFLIPKWFNIWQTRSLDMFTVSVIFETLIRRLARTWALLSFSSCNFWQFQNINHHPSCSKSHDGKWCCGRPVHSVQLVFNLCKAYCLSKTNINDNSILFLLFSQKHSLKRLSKIAEILVNTWKFLFLYLNIIKWNLLENLKYRPNQH